MVTNGTQTRTAVVWWRVSTEDQRETSSETQIAEARTLAETEGYTIPQEYILGTDWHSLSVWESPPMERLKELIREGSIQAIFMYDPDRGPSKPFHRLHFRALCEKLRVEVRCCHGQVPQGDMGELMEFVSAWSKEKQMLRAQQGASDGLRDRARIRGLPATPGAPYGYRWNGIQFELDLTRAPIARRIWDMALDGLPLRRIARELAGPPALPSPTGRDRWSTSTIASILSNPTYKGLYVALRTKKAEPKTRLGPTYGKSTTVPRDEQEHISLPGIVAEALVTPEEFDRVQERLARNKAEGGRVLQAYLLKGLVLCEGCGRHWRGKLYRRRGSQHHRYICNGSERGRHGLRCSPQSVDGPRLETRVWDRVVSFLSEPELFLSSLEGERRWTQEARQRAEASIHTLTKRLAKLDEADARAYAGYARGITSEDTYSRVSAELQAERGWVAQELQRAQDSLKDARRTELSVEKIKELYPVVVDRIHRSSFEDKRFILECLGTEVMVGTSGVSLSLGVPELAMSSVSDAPGRVAWESA